jgi:echinoderm microtubule-associated protein-like 5
MFRPDSDSIFVSVGFKHVNFWTVAGAELLKKKGVLTDCNSKDKLKKMPTMLSVAFGQENVTYTGSMTGDIFVWKDIVLTRVINNAHNGPIFSMYTSLFDGCIVTGAKERKSNKKDNSPVKVWSKDMNKIVKTYNIEKDNSISVVKSVCRTKNKIIVGTKSGSIYEINEKMNDIDSVVLGHAEGDFHGLSVHPNKDIFCTGSYDGHVRVWDIYTKKLLCFYNAEQQVHSVNISPSGDLIALGSSEGQIIILKNVNNFERLEKCDTTRQRKACITDLKFSPSLEQGTTILAAGSADCAIDFMEVTNDGKLTRIGYCKQVPGPVSVFDFSSQGEYIKVSTANHKKIIYSVPMGNEIKPEVIQDKVEWNNWTR